MVKVVISTCIGGYGLSAKAFERLMELGYKPEPHEMKRYEEKLRDVDDPLYSSYVFSDDEERANPMLVQVVEELGEEANGYGAELHVVEVPDDAEWYIGEDDTGYESIHEKHHVWGYRRPV